MVKTFQNHRKRKGAWVGGGNCASKKSKGTRRIYTGCKHYQKSSKLFLLVGGGKGGGRQTIDVPNEYTITQLQEKLMDTYFTQGTNRASQLSAEDLDVDMSSFQGEKLPGVIQGEPFTVERYCKWRYTYPVRVYLETCLKKEQQTTSTQEEEDLHVVSTGTPTVQFSRMPAIRRRLQLRPILADATESTSDTQIDHTLPDIYIVTDENQRADGNSSVGSNNSPSQDSTLVDDSVIGLLSENPLPDINPDGDSLSVETVYTIPMRLSSKIIAEKKNIVNVTRKSSVLPGAMRAFQRSTFSPIHQLSVKFTSEQGIDDGGLTREFLRLLTLEISRMPIFTGPESARRLDLHFPAFYANLYQTVGSMMAYSLVHNGPAPTFLSEMTFRCLVVEHDEVPETLTLDDVLEPTYKDQILQVRNAEQISDYDDVYELIQLAGCSSMSITLERKDELCQALLHYVVITRIKPCIDQFCRGLQTLGVLNEVRRNPTQMRELFCYNQGKKLDSVMLEAVFETDLSISGSNTRVQEDVALTNWGDFLLDLEGGGEPISLNDVLVYTTRASDVPPLGFSPQPRLIFHEAAVNDPENSKNFPTANTCGNILDLPLITEYELFKRNTTSAMSFMFFTSE